MLLFAMLFSSSAFAWEFTEISVANRNFEIRTDYYATFTVSNVRCTATDGYDSLYVQGFFAPTGRWFNINRTISGSGQNIRNRLRQIDANLLPAYMNFCARINRY